jgi:hypothetical protein
MEKEYDIALSFSGDDRDFVEKVASALVEIGITVFYDDYFQIDLWGKDLYQYLNDLYKTKSIFTVIFISKSYKEKLWTRHELKSAQARAFKENYEYILPVRIDDTDLPGVNETTGYLDVSNMTPEELAIKIKLKLMESDYFDKSKLTNQIYDGLTISDGWNESTKYFHFEFGRAFPEITSNKLFTNKKEIYHRLAVLLTNPTAIGSSDSAHDPIWIFRGIAAMPVKRFKIIDDDTCLLNYEEMNIESMYVYKEGAYWQDFIYLKLKPQPQTCISSYTEENILDKIINRGFADEEFGIFKGRYISSIEVDNGHYVSNGKIHPINGRAEKRIRYLSKYSFFISAKASPLNYDNSKFQQYVELFCREECEDKRLIEEFITNYEKLNRIDKRY